MSVPEWLPDLVRLDEVDGDWNQFLDLIYEIFRRDFIQTHPHFWEKPCRLKRGVELQGKHYTFWHLISEGATEEDRLPDLRRCERVGWTRPMIERVATEGVVYWKSDRGSARRWLIALPDFSFVVVLEDRKDHVLLWTAYCVEREHRRRKLRKEYERYRDSNR
jgi:hypothetical protein